MNDDFEDSLRDSLRRATQAAPDEPTRSEGARAYAASVRRRRTGVLAVAAAAVVVAAITIVPTVLDRSDGRGDPVAGPPQTQTPQQPVELPDQPFECPSGDGPVEPRATPTDGTIAPGAVLARVCPIQPEGTAWAPPLDALTSDVDAVASTVNRLPVAEDRMPCNDDLGPAYLMVFQYPDGNIVQVRGDLYGCQLVSFGSLERQGAGDALKAYFAALAAQRGQSRPPPTSSLPTPACTLMGGLGPMSLVPHDLTQLAVTQAIVCLYSDYSADPDGAVLSRDEIADLTADLHAHTEKGATPPACGSFGWLAVVVTNEFGDVLVLQENCGVFIWGDQGWTPTEATLDMLRAALR